MLGEGQEKDEIKSERLGKYKGKTRHGKFFDSGWKELELDSKGIFDKRNEGNSYVNSGPVRIDEVHEERLDEEDISEKCHMCEDSNNSELNLHDYINNTVLQKCQKHDNYSNLVIRVQHWQGKIKKKKKKYPMFQKGSNQLFVSHFKARWGERK